MSVSPNIGFIRLTTCVACVACEQEYVQYLHTLGFVQLEIKILAAKRGPKSALKHRSGEVEERVRRLSQPSRLQPSNQSSNTHAETNMLHFHKSHQGGKIPGTAFDNIWPMTMCECFIFSFSPFKVFWCAKLPFRSRSSTRKSTPSRLADCSPQLPEAFIRTVATYCRLRLITRIDF